MASNASGYDLGQLPALTIRQAMIADVANLARLLDASLSRAVRSLVSCPVEDVRSGWQIDLPPHA